MESSGFMWGTVKTSRFRVYLEGGVGVEDKQPNTTNIPIWVCWWCSDVEGTCLAVENLPKTTNAPKWARWCSDGEGM